MIKTLIVDDDARFRQYITGILRPEPDIAIIGEAVDGQDAIVKTRALKPDLVLMDVSMPGMNGLKAARLLKKEMPGLQVMICTIYDMDEYREAARAAGVGGYILKKSMTSDLIPAIRGVLNQRGHSEGGRAR